MNGEPLYAFALVERHRFGLKQKVGNPMCEQNSNEWMQHVIHKGSRIKTGYDKGSKL